MEWKPILITPFDCDVELAVIENNKAHVLAFPWFLGLRVDPRPVDAAASGFSSIRSISASSSRGSSSGESYRSLSVSPILCMVKDQDDPSYCGCFLSEIELVFMPLRIATIFATAIRQDAQQLDVMLLEEWHHPVIE
jgi:hypothetical protein